MSGRSARRLMRLAWFTHISGGQLAVLATATGVTRFCFTCFSSSSRLVQACSHGNGRGAKESKPQITSPFQAFACIIWSIHWAKTSQEAESLVYVRGGFSYIAKVGKLGSFLQSITTRNISFSDFGLKNHKRVS